MSDEVLFFLVATVVLSAGAASIGRWLSSRYRLSPVPLMGALAATVLVLAVLTGPLGARSLTAVLATLVWAAVLTGTLLLVRRSRPGPAVVIGVTGGFLAVQAATISFVVARFNAADAPREYALLWLPAAMTGAAKDLGEPGSGVDTPLWVRMSEDIGLLPVLVVVLTGFALAFVMRRDAVAREAEVRV